MRGEQIKEHPVLGIYVKDLTEIVAEDSDKLEQMLHQGCKNHVIGVSLVCKQRPYIIGIASVLLKTLNHDSCTYLSINSESFSHPGIGYIGVVAKLNALRAAQDTGEIPQNVNFAIKGAVVRSFLDIHAIEYLAAQPHAPMTGEQIAARAREFTVPVTCYQ